MAALLLMLARPEMQQPGRVESGRWMVEEWRWQQERLKAASKKGNNEVKFFVSGRATSFLYTYGEERCPCPHL